MEKSSFLPGAFSNSCWYVSSFNYVPFSWFYTYAILNTTFANIFLTECEGCTEKYWTKCFDYVSHTVPDRANQ